MKWIFLALAFVLEVIAWVAFSAVGYTLHISSGLKLGMFIVLFVAMIGFWAVFMAPKSSRKFGTKAYYVAKTLIYAVSAYVIFQSKGVKLGALFVALTLLSEAVLCKHNLES